MTHARRAAHLVPRAETLEDRRLMTVAFAPATSYPVAAGVSQVVTGDFNGDGLPDVVSISPQFNGTGQGGSITALLGNGKGGFSSAVDTEIPALNMFGGLASGDFNGDGKLDLVSTAINSTSGLPVVFVLLGNGDGTFRIGPTAVGANSQAAITSGDFNGDGVSDIAVAFGASLMSFVPSNAPVRIYLGQRNGTLLDAGLAGNLGTAPTTPALITGDFNGDGKVDLAGATSASGQVTIFLGNGDGTFRDGGSTPVATETTSLAEGDFNDDGKADLATLDQVNGGVAVLIGRGDGTFSGGPGPQFGFGSQAAKLVAGDFNGDGKVDLAAATYPLNEVRVAVGNGSGAFGPIGAVPAPGDAFSGATDLAAVDLNRDGLSDLVTVNGSPPEVGILLAGGDSTVVGDGPRVTSATVEPRSGKIVLTFGDDVAGLDAASLADVSNYQVIGPYSRLGRHPSRITGISVLPATATGATTVTLTIGGGRPLPHGRYILLVKSGGIIDRAGRALDGEFTGILPSGNGVPGGDFNARFQFNRKTLLPLAAQAPRKSVARRAEAREFAGERR